jgi:hypothetical protein
MLCIPLIDQANRLACIMRGFDRYAVNATSFARFSDDFVCVRTRLVVSGVGPEIVMRMFAG